MDRDHSSLIIILLGGILLVLGGILFVLLVGRDMAISVGRDMAIPVMGGAFGVALVVGTLALFRAGTLYPRRPDRTSAPPGRAKSGSTTPELASPVRRAYLSSIMLLRLRPPGFIEPCLPSPADRPPSGPNCIHEIKHDGFRLIPGGTRSASASGC